MDVETARERGRRKLLFHGGFIGCLICVFPFLSIVLRCVFHSEISCQGSGVQTGADGF